MTKKTLEEVYNNYKNQIDAIVNLPGMKGQPAGRIIAWFYGGSANGWRNFLARKGTSRKMPKEVDALLAKFGKK